MPQEIKEVIFSFTIDPYDDISDNKHLVQAALAQLLNLRLITKRLSVEPAYLRELFVKLQMLRFDIAPTLRRLQHTLPQSGAFLTRLQCSPLPRSSFTKAQPESLLILTLSSLKEVIVDVETLDYPYRKRIYWQSTAEQRHEIKKIVVCAVLSVLPTPRTRTSIWIRYDVQHNLDQTMEDLLRTMPIDRVYILLELVCVGQGRWRDVGLAEVLHIHSRPDGAWTTRLVCGLRAVNGAGWVWRRSRSEDLYIRSEVGRVCDCE